MSNVTIQWREKEHKWRQGKLIPPGTWNTYKECTEKAAEDFMREFSSLPTHKSQFEYRVVEETK